MNPEISHVAGGGRPSPRLRRLLRDTGRGINEFAMIGAGDRVIFRAGWNINFDYLPQRPH